MKKNNSWSILLWSVFLTLFITTSFLYITDSLNKNIAWIKKLKEIDESNNDYTNFSSWTIDLWDNKTLSLLYSKEKWFSWSLWVWDEDIFLSSGNWVLNLKIFSWAVNIINFSWNTVYNSWIYFNNSDKFFTFQTWSIKMINLAWKTNYHLLSDSELIFPYNYKIITQNIWWKDFVINKIIIKNN